MTSVVVDTNVILSFLLDRDAQQQEQATALIERAAARTVELVLHQQVLTELVYVLVNLYDQRREATAQIAGDLLALPGVRAMDSLDWGQVLELWPDPFRDFADAALAAACRCGGHDVIATFDADFRKALVELGLTSYW
jgi:predicted nucleic acid-binding protein